MLLLVGNFEVCSAHRIVISMSVPKDLRLRARLGRRIKYDNDRKRKVRIPCLGVEVLISRNDQGTGAELSFYQHSFIAFRGRESRVSNQFLGGLG